VLEVSTWASAFSIGVSSYSTGSAFLATFFDYLAFLDFLIYVSTF